MNRFIKKYTDWRLLVESDEDGEAGVSTLFKRLLNSDRLRPRLINLLNSSVKKLTDTIETTSIEKTTVVGEHDFGTTKAFIKPTSGRIKDIIPDENNDNTGIFKGHITVFIRIQNEKLINDWISSGDKLKGLTFTLRLYITAKYSINEETEEITFKVSSYKLNKTKEFTNGPFNMVGKLIVTLKNDMISILLDGDEEPIKLIDNVKIPNMNSSIIGLTDTVSIKNIMSDGSN